MSVGKIMEYDSWLNNERLRLIALGRAKEKEVGKKLGELFSTVLITRRFSKAGAHRAVAGYYLKDEKTITINQRVFREGRVYADEVMLHELAHGLDRETEGYTERFTIHDERFITAAKTLGVDVAHYIKSARLKNETEKFEKERRANYIPPEFSPLPDDRNNCYQYFHESKHPSLICRNVFEMMRAYADIYGDWKKDYYKGGKYVMCGWGPRENMEMAHNLFPDLDCAVRKLSRKIRRDFEVGTDGIIVGLRYGFISYLKDLGFRRAMNYDFARVEGMKECLQEKVAFYTCVSVAGFWKGFEEGPHLAEGMIRKYGRPNDNTPFIC